jgi:glucose-1-phosphate cytidylyltransferase
MKVLLLAGGFGTRLSELTEMIPKPMVTIGGRPIVWHIMNYYASFGHKDFYLALGYKSQLIKEYFLNYCTLNADFTVDISTGSFLTHNASALDWKVTLVDTGMESMTGARVKKMQNFIGNESFLLTYGDGLSDIDLTKLLAFHKSHGKMITVTAVRPSARFGELLISQGQVSQFREKPQMGGGWINGGFFVVEPSFFELIGDDAGAILEGKPLETAARMGQLMAYEHPGFWQCMDTKRDRDMLEEIWGGGSAPWQI